MTSLAWAADAAPAAGPAHRRGHSPGTRARTAGVAALAVLVIALAVWMLVLDPVAPRNLAGLTGDPTRGEYVLRMAGCIAGAFNAVEQSLGNRIPWLARRMYRNGPQIPGITV